MYLQQVFSPLVGFNLLNECLELVTRLSNYCRCIFSRLGIFSADFASRWRRKLVIESLHFHTSCVFVVMRHVSRLTAYLKMCTSERILPLDT